VKQKLRCLLVIGFTVTMTLAPVCGQQEKETFGDKLKKLFVRPTPTATPRRSHKTGSLSPTATPVSSRASSDGGTTIPAYGETPLPRSGQSPSVETLEPVEAKTPEPQYFEAVRPINSRPHKWTEPELGRTRQTIAPANATATPVPEDAEEKKPEDRPTPSLPPVPESTSSSAIERREPDTVSLSEADIIESNEYPESVRRIIALGLDLAKRDLNYKYASADPANGGLDCSGFIYYVLTKAGSQNVPRDAREQYVWVRKAGNFQAVLAHGDDTFELDALKPGDLLFWTNNSGVSREPEISQAMIYIGRDSVTKQRLMIGASEGSTYQGKKKSGVGVFDLKLRPVEQNPDEGPTSVFVGYGRFP
jgi:cell wall-associated NlpC family hydrolase